MCFFLRPNDVMLRPGQPLVLPKSVVSGALIMICSLLKPHFFSEALVAVRVELPVSESFFVSLPKAKSL